MVTPVPGESRNSDKLSCFSLSCVKDASNGASVVSPAEALGAFFAEEPVRMPRCSLFLNNLGLNGSHCEAMAQELGKYDSLSSQIDMLDLSRNTSIGQKGYAALLELLNRGFNIGFLKVDNQKLKSTFDMVVHMNLHQQRGRFLEKGIFQSKDVWVNFLAGQHWPLLEWKQMMKMMTMKRRGSTLFGALFAMILTSSTPENRAQSLILL
jgi:hypothetical protein